MTEVNLFWFRRDLRLEDNHALFRALEGRLPVLPIFIFDRSILDDLEDKTDCRVTFIYDLIQNIHQRLTDKGKRFEVYFGDVLETFSKLSEDYIIRHIYCNKDYEPYAIKRDNSVAEWAKSKGIGFSSYKDQVIFEQSEIVKDDGSPYVVFTPYSKKWKKAADHQSVFKCWVSELHISKILEGKKEMIGLEEMGFLPSRIKVPAFSLKTDLLRNYSSNRDLPYLQGTSRLSSHLRFGSVSIREICRQIRQQSESFLNELIWREFYMQILFQFPDVVLHNFRRKYDAVQWRNDKEDFKKWCEGNTGYPMVDAGMRQLNATGWMHNRVRMIVASFLCKHLLIDWRWGEAYFARKLLDFELSSNNGGWQWAAGTGTDAAPYFRIFNPYTQRKRFDPDWQYCKTWISELNTANYPEPIVKHELARQRCLDAYKRALN